jgi:hypothetical protein
MPQDVVQFKELACFQVSLFSFESMSTCLFCFSAASAFSISFSDHLPGPLNMPALISYHYNIAYTLFNLFHINNSKDSTSELNRLVFFAPYATAPHLSNNATTIYHLSISLLLRATTPYHLLPLNKKIVFGREYLVFLAAYQDLTIRIVPHSSSTDLIIIMQNDMHPVGVICQNLARYCKQEQD